MLSIYSFHPSNNKKRNISIGKSHIKLNTLEPAEMFIAVRIKNFILEETPFDLYEALRKLVAEIPKNIAVFS